MPADVVDLARARQRRLALASPAARPEESARPKVPTYIEAAPSLVLVGFSDGSELELAPARARFWAEQLQQMAATAEVLQRDADFIVTGPEGGDGG